MTDPVVLNLGAVVQLTDETFYQLATSQDAVKLERAATGEIIVVPPIGGETGNKNVKITQQLGNWEDSHEELGISFDSSTEFKLPNGAYRSPDAAWISRERWNSLSIEEQTKFPPLCPDFLIELRSPSDRLQPLQDKMQEYLECGLRLGWLINRQDQQVEIYRQGKPKEVLQQPETLSGEEVLPGFVLKLKKIW